MTIALVIGLGLHILFDAGVQKADVGGQVDDGFAIQLDQQAQHPMRAGMLRPHAEEHILFGISNFHAGANFGPQFFNG
jgi:hypothetical protein